MRLVFDCSELSYFLEKSGHRAGVFFVSLNLFRELKKRDNIDLVFYCDYKRYYFMKDVIDKVDEFKDIKLLKENSFINKIAGKLIYYTDNLPIRVKYGIKILSRFYDTYFLKINKKNLEQLKDYDSYFSPFSPPSREIQESNILKFRMLHDVIPIMENGQAKSPISWYYKIYNSINDKDFYVTNSNSTHNDILKYFPFIKKENIRTTYLGADKNFSFTPNKTCDKYVFSLCTLGKRKNLSFAIKNFFTFIEKNNISDLKLVLGGSIWKKFEKDLSKTISNYDCTKIIQTGYIDESELPKLYSNALFFIYPSLYEGFGLPVLEAMQCGCPVITSNVSSLPEVIGDSGIQINPHSDEEMVKAYEKMYYDSSFREECRYKGLERAKQFSWEKCTSELLEFMKEKSI